MMEIRQMKKKKEHSDENSRKEKQSGGSFIFCLWPVSLMIERPSLAASLFTITVPRMNLPRMTAQLAALTSQEQGSY